MPSQDNDIVFVLRAELVNSLLDVWYKTNTTISLQDAFATFAPGMQLTCDSALGIRLPNMRFDKLCADGPRKNPYPIDVQLSLPTKPGKVFIDDASHTGGFVMDQLRLRAVRTDTNKVLMDFIMKEFAANLTLFLDDMSNLRFGYNIQFKEASIVERGTTVKFARDVFQLSDCLDDGSGVVQDWLNGNFTFRYLLGITMRKAFLKLDEETESLFLGLTPDPVFIGTNQHSGFPFQLS